MKITLKLLALIASLGTLFFFLKQKPDQKNQQIEYITIASEQKSPKLLMTKPLYSAPVKNYLEVGTNINSKR